MLLGNNDFSHGSILPRVAGMLIERGAAAAGELIGLPPTVRETPLPKGIENGTLQAGIYRAATHLPAIIP